jgi:hypothetical protein
VIPTRQRAEFEADICARLNSPDPKTRAQWPKASDDGTLEKLTKEWLKTIKDDDGNPAPRVPLSLKSHWRQMLEWNVPDEKPSDRGLLTETESECGDLADEIIEKLMLYRAKYAHAARILDDSEPHLRREPCIPASVNAEILRMVDIVTKEEWTLCRVVYLSRVMGAIPEECCPEAAPYFDEFDGKKSEPATDSRAGCDSL